MTPVEIVAEIGSVHDGSFGNALKLIDLAKDVGATVVKFQLHIPEAETTRQAPSPGYFTQEQRFDYFKRTSFSSEQWSDLYQAAHAKGLKFGCSVFSIEALNQLLDTGVDIIKIPSGEVTNLPLLRTVAKVCDFVHISSGMSTFAELEIALGALHSVRDIVLFQCRSEYPVPPERIGLNVVSEMKERFNLPIGLSDHSVGIEMSIAAVAIGATAIEKHLTFSRSMYGSDAFNALEPDEFCDLSAGVNRVWSAIQNPVDKNEISELLEMRTIFQKGIYAKKYLPAGHKLTMDDLKFLKPMLGVPVENVDSVVGKVLVQAVKQDAYISNGDLQ
jgi:N,N'-diacetyllegionaminate synthase